MSDVKLAACPNPECVGCDDVIYSSNGMGAAFCECANCGMAGPVEDDIAGAARLWNALPRPTAGEMVKLADVERLVDGLTIYLSERRMERLLTELRALPRADGDEDVLAKGLLAARADERRVTWLAASDMAELAAAGLRHEEGACRNNGVEVLRAAADSYRAFAEECRARAALATLKDHGHD